MAAHLEGNNRVQAGMQAAIPIMPLCYGRLLLNFFSVRPCRHLVLHVTVYAFFGVSQNILRILPFVRQHGKVNKDRFSDVSRTSAWPRK